MGGALAAVLAAAFFVQVHFGSLQKSLTWDEPAYIAAGYAYLKWKFFHLNPSHPPLLQYLAGLPLFFLEPNVPWDHRVFRLTERSNRITGFARELIFHPEHDVARIAYWARISRHILGTLLILAVFLWGRRLYGDGPALFATGFAAFCPNLIAHAKLATEDLGCATFMFLSVWMLWRCLRAANTWPWALCGLVTGLALVSKYTALLLGPIFLLLIGFSWLQSPAPRRLQRDALNLGVLALAALAVIGAAYDFSFDYTHYLRGIGEIYKDTVAEPNYYLLGETYWEPKWYYFIAAASMKTPLPTLLIVGAAALSAIADRAHREAQLFLLIPAAVIIGVSFFDATNLGLRRILPAFPFILLFSAQFLTGRFARARRTAAGLLLVLTMVTTARIYPHHLAYFNAAVGGPERGPYLLNDSNLDWGQDLPALAEWQRAHPEAVPMKLLYFGMAKPESYGVSAVAFEDNDRAAPSPGFYAVSAHQLAYFHGTRQMTEAHVDWLEKYEPIARVGYSIYIYRFPEEEKSRE